MKLLHLLLAVLVSTAYCEDRGTNWFGVDYTKNLPTRTSEGTTLYWYRHNTAYLVGDDFRIACYVRQRTTPPQDILMQVNLQFFWKDNGVTRFIEGSTTRLLQVKPSGDYSVEGFHSQELFTVNIPGCGANQNFTKSLVDVNVQPHNGYILTWKIMNHSDEDCQDVFAAPVFPTNKVHIDNYYSVMYKIVNYQFPEEQDEVDNNHVKRRRRRAMDFAASTLDVTSDDPHDL